MNAPEILTDAELLAGFQSCRLGEFHHADHVRVAFLYVRRYACAEALVRFPAALKRFATAKGKPGLYHETITWAFLLLIAERIARWAGEKGKEPDWVEFSAANPDLLAWKPGVVHRYYREETLGSELAKKVFLWPDRAGCPQ
ncbi:MAG: hypothetical protein JO041_12415 [Acidobacteria bacterium]|nr:hypothetical protein [Acidobacteriota bacterium]